MDVTRAGDQYGRRRTDRGEDGRIFSETADRAHVANFQTANRVKRGGVRL